MLFMCLKKGECFHLGEINEIESSNFSILLISKLENFELKSSVCYTCLKAVFIM